MKQNIFKRSCILLPVLAGSLLSACTASPKKLYQWEAYQPQVYEYLNGQHQGVEAQISVLEQGLQKIRAKGAKPPPGYHAHLGMLYSSLGKDDQMLQEFQTEVALFPESRAYMEFLLKKVKN